MGLCTRDQRREGNTRDYKALLVLMFYVWPLALVPSIRIKDITARPRSSGRVQVQCREEKISRPIREVGNQGHHASVPELI